MLSFNGNITLRKKIILAKLKNSQENEIEKTGYSCIWDKDFRINYRCWKMSSYTPHVRRVACADVTISRALLLYKIAFILLGSGRKQ